MSTVTERLLQRSTGAEGCLPVRMTMFNYHAEMYRYYGCQNALLQDDFGEYKAAAGKQSIPPRAEVNEMQTKQSRRGDVTVCQEAASDFQMMYPVYGELI